MRSGRLWSSGGTGRTSRSQPRRRAIRLIWSAKAPQATIAVLTGRPVACEWGGFQGNREVPRAKQPLEEGGSWGKHGFPHGSEPKASDSSREGQLVDEQIVEVGSAGELDVVDLVEHRTRRMAFRHRQRRDLGALAGD